MQLSGLYEDEWLRDPGAMRRLPRMVGQSLSALRVSSGSRNAWHVSERRARSCK
jgi:hypothetical protein